jgi:tetratricopeptide (TPR) repeat protein
MVALLVVPSAVFSQGAADGLARVALVIGNGNYEGAARLNNPANDADDIGDMLSGLGFDVDVLTDADLYSMEDAVLRFRDRLAGSPDSVGFFYYAGHGVQSNGENYLIPVDARPNSESLLRTRAIPLQFVLDSLSEARNRLNIIVLDACRDNPFSWARSSARGLAVVGQLPPASIVVYSTSAGKVAQDGVGRNGVFTEELLKHLSTPGLDISEVLRRTGEGVQRKTEGIQIPAIYSQFFGFLQLAPGEGGSVAAGTGSGAVSGPESGSSLDYLPAFFDEAPMDAKRAIANAEELTWDGKWLSAWNILAAADPNDRDPYIFAEKIRTVLDGNTDTDMYQGFWIADMSADGDTDAAREAGTLNEEYFDFDVHAVAQTMLDRGVEAPPVLASALGDFYYRAYDYCGDSYVLSAEDTKAEALRWYDMANENYILVDLVSILHYAELLIDAGRAGDAITVLREESEWEPDDTDLHLQLVDAYVVTGETDSAFAELDGLIQRAASKDEARNYYSKALDIAFDQNDKQALNRYLAAMEADYPDDWLAGLARHKVAVSSGDNAGAQKIADDLLTKFPLHTEVLEGVLTDWLASPAGTDGGIAFLNRWIGKSKDDPLALGTFYLYRALYRYYSVESSTQSYLRKSSIQNALADLDSAEKMLAQASGADKTTVEAIQYIRKELQDALGQ